MSPLRQWSDEWRVFEVCLLELGKRITQETSNWLAAHKQQVRQVWRAQEIARRMIIVCMILRLVIRLAAGQTDLAKFLDDLTTSIIATLILK